MFFICSRWLASCCRCIALPLVSVVSVETLLHSPHCGANDPRQKDFFPDEMQQRSVVLTDGDDEKLANVPKTASRQDPASVVVPQMAMVAMLVLVLMLVEAPKPVSQDKIQMRVVVPQRSTSVRSSRNFGRRWANLWRQC